MYKRRGHIYQISVHITKKNDPKYSYFPLPFKRNQAILPAFSFSLPSVGTNYGKFNLRFIGAKIWNTISDDKKRMPKHSFKEAIKSNLLNSY